MYNFACDWLPQEMKNFISDITYHNTLEDWLISAAIIAGVIVLAKAVYWLFKIGLKQITSRTATTLDDLILERMQRPVLLMIVLLGTRYALERLHFTESLDIWIQRGFVFVITLNVTWFVLSVIESLIETYLVPYAKTGEGSRIDDQMLLLIQRMARALIWTIGIIAALNNAGFDVGALIAGLGIGGLALALAAQDTVKNIFGGIVIFVDKPFRIGDQIKIDNVEGFVEYIGIRSTRLRTLNGRIVTIPNLQFSDRPIENVTIEPARRVNTVLSLTYDTPPEKVELAIKLLKEISNKNNHVIESERTMIFFEKFNAYSLDVNFYYFIRKESDLFATQTSINIQILKTFNENRLEFAFPTQTVYKKTVE